MTTQTPDISDLIAEMDETYAAVDRELREYSRLCQEGSTQCLSCSAKVRYQKLGQPTKIAWPAQADLLARVESTSFSAVARELGVSDNAVRKRLRSSMAEQRSLKS